MRARGDIPVADQPWGDIFLVIDGWGNFRTEYEGLESAVLDIVARGLGYGIPLILTASCAMEVRANLKDLLMNRLELRLGDPMDSELDRKAAGNVPAGVPGRGITPEALHFMAAGRVPCQRLPLLSGPPAVDDRHARPPQAVLAPPRGP